MIQTAWLQAYLLYVHVGLRVKVLAPHECPVVLQAHTVPS